MSCSHSCTRTHTPECTSRTSKLDTCTSCSIWLARPSAPPSASFCLSSSRSSKITYSRQRLVGQGTGRKGRGRRPGVHENKFLSHIQTRTTVQHAFLCMHASMRLTCTSDCDHMISFSTTSFCSSFSPGLGSERVPSELR